MISLYLFFFLEAFSGGGWDSGTIGPNGTVLIGRATDLNASHAGFS